MEDVEEGVAVSERVKDTVEEEETNCENDLDEVRVQDAVSENVGGRLAEPVEHVCEYDPVIVGDRVAENESEAESDAVRDIKELSVKLLVKLLDVDEDPVEVMEEDVDFIHDSERARQ